MNKWNSKILSEMVHCVVVPVLSGFDMSYGETLRIKRQSKYKNLSELEA